MRHGLARMGKRNGESEKRRKEKVQSSGTEARLVRQVSPCCEGAVDGVARVEIEKDKGGRPAALSVAMQLLLLLRLTDWLTKAGLQTSQVVLLDVRIIVLSFVQVYVRCGVALDDRMRPILETRRERRVMVRESQSEIAQRTGRRSAISVVVEKVKSRKGPRRRFRNKSGGR